MTGEEGTEGKVNDKWSGKFRQKVYVFIDKSSPTAFKNYNKEIGT